MWQKPELGIVEFDGSKKNNIVMRRDDSGDPGEAGVIKDVREVDPLRRYKMFFYRYGEGMQAGSGSMALAFSQDGLRWSKPQLLPEIQSDGDRTTISFGHPSFVGGLGSRDYEAPVVNAS